MPGPENVGGESGGIARSLRRVRRAAWAMLVVQSLARILAVFVGVVVVLAALDYFLRTPTWLRAGVWAGGVGAASWAVWTLVLPALRFRPSLTEVALRVERTPAGRSAGLGGVLAAGLELGREGAGEPVVRAAADRSAGLGLGAVLSARRLRGAMIAAACVAGVVVSLGVMIPALAGIGAKRILAPWSGAQWPKRTAVADATSRAPHARGSGLLLRAVVLKNIGGLGSDNTGAARVWGKYRLIVDGEPGVTRRVLMTGQDRTEVVRGAGERAEAGVREGALFEYLIEPWGLTPGGADAETADASAAHTAELDYWFETEDDQTEAGRVLLVEPPAVVSAAAQVTPPAYAAADQGVGRKRIELGAGVDELAAVPASLVGSRVSMSIELNKAVPWPVGEGVEGAERERLLARTFGQTGARALGAAGSRVVFDGKRWTLEWTLREAVRLDVHVEDEYRIVGPECSYSFAVIEDRDPSAAITLPTEDRTVLPTAVVDLMGEGRDDVGLVWTGLEYRVARPPTGSEGAPPEAGPEQTELARVTGERSESEGGVLPRQLVVGATLDLSKLGVSSGDEVWVTALAADAFLLDGATHEASRSTVRKLRIISAEQLIEQVWAELSGVRRSAMATDEEVSRLMRDAARGAEASRMERTQAGLTDRVSRDREALERVGERLRENDLHDETLDQVMRDAERLLDQAGKSSVKAAEALREAGANEQNGAAPDTASRAEAEAAQERVRKDLADLIELLDQGQDTWATRRAIERLLEEQKALRDRTGKAGERTTGKQPEELTRQERDELEQVAGEQRGLAQKAGEAMKQMMDTEPKLRKNDPAAADALAQAARRAQQQQLTQKMEEAAQRAQENQTNRAQEQQDRAVEAMEEMLQALQNTAKNRDEVLRRKLASLMESLDALIADQRAQIGALVAGIEKGDITGLDRGMARLHQNTLGVLDEAAQGPREVQPVAALIQEAAGAMSNSVVALRVEPFNADEARAQEDISLEKLIEAKELAERLDREAANRQAQRKRDELKRAYREALADQLSMRAETEPLVGVEATRRTRATARTLADREQVLQDVLAGLERDTKELSEAVMFSFAHRRLDASIGGAARRLGEGEADAGVLAQQDAAARVLQQIVQALEEAQKQEDEFRKQNQPQGGGGQQQGGGEMPVVPPMAEVKLLRSMQQEVADLTREASEKGAETAEVEGIAGLQGELAAQGQALIKKLMERRRPPRPAGGEGAGEGPVEPAPKEEGKGGDTTPEGSAG